MSSTWEIKQWSLPDRLKLGLAPQSSEEYHEKGYRRVICNDPQANIQFKYQGNSVSTTKFNLFTFLPKGLFEQFRRLANLYFLVIAILSLAPTSPIQPITNILPLVLVLSISLSKEAFEDWRRFRNDKRINSSLVEVLHGDSWANITWSKLAVGQLVRIKSNEYFPADLVLLSTSNDEGLCYIETSNLDGESNLKTRRALEQTWKYGNSNEASKFSGEIRCEHPNDSLYSFTGNLVIEKETYPISVENVLLRGCSLKNTSWIVGIVIFAGHETKCSGFFLNNNLWYLQLGKDSGYVFSAGSTVLVDVLMTISLITLYNTIIPISLYVSIEIIKFIQSTQLINKDINMYDKETNMHAQARTSNLNDELGQVEYIFSDKTGTLTQNVMEFHMCSIGGVIYGSDISEAQTVGTSTSKLPSEQEKGFNFYDRRLMGGAWRNERNPEICKEFFRCLAICHSALPEGETTPEKIKYLASSPDEVALIVAAKRLGFFFHRRTISSVFVRESHVEGPGCIQDVEYKILNVLEFSSSRKRQSVICIHPSGQLVLYSKGADVAIFQRLENNMSTTALDTWGYLEKFASAGHRTLCVAYRFLDVDMYNSWNEKFMQAKSALTEREEKINQVAELIEQQLILLGCVAIEDKLQDGVAMCIHSLLKAGIKIWVLTGDKLETAINVGYAACLLSPETRQIIISSDKKGDFAEVEIKNWVEQQLIASLDDRNTKDNNTTLVIDGRCLTYALEPDLRETFLKLSCQCFTVICCRVTPLQKAQVTILIRHHARRRTLSIGDGANDVSMIQAAHVGVAIRGQEGMQAVMASDFAISQFRFLTELLLVHGRLSYIRISKVVIYFFYKNITLTMTQVWFTFFCGYSAANFYNDWYQSLYNVLFTSLPAIAIGILDQDVSTAVSKQFPQLYKAGIDNLYFRWQLLAGWLLSSVLQSFVIFYLSIFTGFGGKAHGKILGQWDMGTLSFSCVVTTVNLQLLIGNSFLTHWHFISIFGSIVIWFLFLLFFTSIYSFWDAKENVYGQLIVPFSTLDFWLILLGASVAALVVDFAFEGFQRIFMPYDYQIIQEMEHCRSNDVVSERIERRPSAELRARLLSPS